MKYFKFSVKTYSKYYQNNLPNNERIKEFKNMKESNLSADISASFLQ
jgi:hypothetical protein